MTGSAMTGSAKNDAPDHERKPGEESGEEGNVLRLSEENKKPGDGLMRL